MKYLLAFFVLVSPAWSQSTQESRQFLQLAATTTSTTVSTMVTPQFGSQPVPARKISIRNDGASGSADLYIALNRSSVSVPADNTVNVSMVIKPGEEYRDATVNVSQVAYRSSAGTQAMRITWGF